MDGKKRLLSLPVEKQEKALYMLRMFVANKKATVKQIQSLTGLLNFLTRVVVPGCAFTHRMYAAISEKMMNLKAHHHINLDKEFRSDCSIWISFLTEMDRNPSLYCRPFIDLSEVLTAQELQFHTDASANESLGCGGFFGSKWFFLQWESNYIRKFNPIIEYLELYALCMGIFIWGEAL